MTGTAEFTVVGEEKLHCEGCEQRVDRALKCLAGVRDVGASYHSQQIEVSFDPSRLGAGDLQQRLELLGYEVSGGGGAS